MTNEKAISFNAEMVNAILAGRKTQTRRVIKLQPPHKDSVISQCMSSTHTKDVGKHRWLVWDGKYSVNNDLSSKYFNIPYNIGDNLWVRETFRIHRGTDECGCSCDPYCTCGEEGSVLYRADFNEEEEKYSPLVHMKKEQSRITLEITDIKVERLNDISEGDIEKEGIYKKQIDFDAYVYSINEGETGSATAKLSFQNLWNSIYKKDPIKSWESNPYVWVINFKLITKRGKL